MEFPEIMALYNSLFTKDRVKFIPEHSLGTNIMFMKWLMREPEILIVIRPLVDYLFYLKPKHFYYLLFAHIPRRLTAPKVKQKGKKIRKKQDQVLTKVREVLGWSEIEMEKSQDIIDKVIVPEKRHWKREFGLR